MLFLDYGPLSGGAEANSGDSEAYALACEVGFCPYVVPWFAVRPSGDCVWVHAGFEQSGFGQRPISRPERIRPRVLFHRVHMSAPRELVFTRLAEASPRSLISYHQAMCAVRTKWGAELAFRYGDRSGTAVARPETYLVTKREMRRLSDVGRRHPLIFKPSQGSQGRGILVSTPRTFDAVVCAALAAPTSCYVVQRVVDSAPRLDGRVFDLRVYALVRRFEPLDFHLFRDGIVRIAAIPAETDGEFDPLAVVTNCAYRESHGHCVENLTISELLTDLQAQGHNVSEFWNRMEALASRVFTCFANAMHVPPSDKSRLFFLTGLDIALTENGNGLEPLFIESNYTPLLHGFGPDSVDAGLRATTKRWLGDLLQRCM